MRKTILCLCLAAAGLALAVGCSDDEDLVPYFTRVEADPECGVAPLPVQFLAFASGGDLKDDPTGGNTYLDIEWNFGDGGTGVGSILAHTFVDPGVYDVVVTVKDDDGSSPPPRTLTVEIRADSLSIDAYADLATVAVGDPVTFGVDAEMCDFAGEASDYNRFDFLWQMDDARETEYDQRAPTHVFAAGDVGTREVRVRLRDFQTTTTRWATVNVEVTAAP